MAIKRYMLYTDTAKASADFETRIKQRGVNTQDPPYNSVGNGVFDDTASVTLANADAVAASVSLMLPSGTFLMTAFPAPLAPPIGRGKMQSATYRLTGLFAALTIALSNWTAGTGGSNLLHNPDSNFFTGNVNSSVIAGGRGPNYTNRIVQAGANVVELAGITSGGDNYIEVLAGWIGGGAHHIAGLNDTGAGSHIAIGGGSTNTVRADYAGIFCGFNNSCYGIKAVICGGDSNRIGVTADQTLSRGSYIGAGVSNTIDGIHGWIPSGNLCKVQKDYGGAYGMGAVANYRGEIAHASYFKVFAGDRQYSDMALQRQTTDGVATQLVGDPTAAASIAVGANTHLTIFAIVQGVRTDVLGSVAHYWVTGNVSNIGGALAIKAQATTTLQEDVAGYNADLQVSGGNVMVRGTGAAAHTVEWFARVFYTQVRI